jgi:hypothetical protein
MRADRPACSTISLATEEPLYGTASRYRFWLLVEQPGRWGHEALVDSGLRPDVGAALNRLGTTLGMRVLLIKQRERPADAPRRCFLVYTGRKEQRVVAFDVPDPADLTALDLPDLARERFQGFGQAAAEPLYLVCTHGKHDPCCARLGGPVFRALRATHGDSVWEATHVGGDRFAGNVVAFPHGLYFGRVPAEAAGAVADRYADGHIDLRFYRGRSCYQPAVQASEYFLRHELGLTGVEEAAVLHQVTGPGNVHVVAWQTKAGRHEVEVEASRWDERPLTCKGDRPGRPRRFRLLAIRRR